MHDGNRTPHTMFWRDKFSSMMEKLGVTPKEDPTPPLPVKVKVKSKPAVKKAVKVAVVKPKKETKSKTNEKSTSRKSKASKNR